MKRILVADDSVTIQKVIALTFADEPFEVESVGTGAEALEKIKESRPDIVLADVIMPQMNGYELCRSIKDNADTGSIPVLLLAGTFEAFDESEAQSVQADDFITKPFESGELIEKVKTLIDAPGRTDAAPEAVIPTDAMEPVAEPQPAAPQPESAPAPEPVPAPAAAPQPEPATDIPPAPAADPAGQEPDIWDILSDGDGAPEAAPAPVTPPAAAAEPGLGQMEDTGVVDVGSFEVGLDRPDDVAAGPVVRQTDTLQEGEMPVPPAPEPIPAPEPVAAPAPEAAQVTEDAIDKSMEDREKDFFGFETEGDDADMAADIMEEAVEEVSFDMEETPAAPAGADQEASFIVPEPAPEVQITGETISPDFLAPDQSEPVTTAAPEPTLTPEVQSIPEPMIPVPEQMFEPVTEPVPAEPAPQGEAPQPPAAEPVPIPEPPPIVTEPAPASESVPEPPAEIPPIPVPEPELAVPDTPAPVEAPAFEAPVEPAAAPAGQAPAAAGELDEATRKLIEEKVEKIAWEVVPEMAEMMIREAIEKIKGGS
jgi:CheY-like chemotaxis protein